MHYYFQLAQQHHANLQQSSSPTTSTTTTATVAQPQGTIQIVQPQVQTVQVSAVEQNPSSSAATETTQTPIILQSSGQAISQSPPGNIQIIQQIVTPTGEVQQIPVSALKLLSVSNFVSDKFVIDPANSSAATNDKATAARQHVAACYHSSPHCYDESTAASRSGKNYLNLI